MKICICENRRSKQSQLWSYNREPQEKRIFSVILIRNFDNLEPSVKALSEQALKAANQLLAFR